MFVAPPTSAAPAPVEAMVFSNPPPANAFSAITELLSPERMNESLRPKSYALAYMLVCDDAFVPRAQNVRTLHSSWEVDVCLR